MSRCKTFLYSSSSKHDGLAGTRFGWGLIKDMDLATRMSVTLDIVVLGLSVDAELRVLTSLQTILSKPIVCVGGRGGGGGGGGGGVDNIMESRTNRCSIWPHPQLYLSLPCTMHCGRETLGVRLIVHTILLV